MILRYKSLSFFALLFTLSIAGCNDDDKISGKIKTVTMYGEDHSKLKTESYEYDAGGRLVKERILILFRSGTEIIREFAYQDDKIIKMTEGKRVVDFAYNGQGQLLSITSDNIFFSLGYTDGKLTSANNHFLFNYDDHENLTFITNSDPAPMYMAKGSYEFDDHKYVYSTFPTSLRLYFALTRSEDVTLSSNIFRFNPGPNNISRKNQYKPSGEIQFYFLFKYQYQHQGFPTKLDLESYYFDANGDSKVSHTDQYTFEYY